VISSVSLLEDDVVGRTGDAFAHGAQTAQGLWRERAESMRTEGTVSGVGTSAPENGRPPSHAVNSRGQLRTESTAEFQVIRRIASQ
jgi:hypothetical protein